MAPVRVHFLPFIIQSLTLLNIIRWSLSWSTCKSFSKRVRYSLNHPIQQHVWMSTAQLWSFSLVDKLFTISWMRCRPYEVDNWQFRYVVSIIKRYKLCVENLTVVYALLKNRPFDSMANQEPLINLVVCWYVKFEKEYTENLQAAPLTWSL